MTDVVLQFIMSN